MKIKKILTLILLYAVFAFIPILPYFTYSKSSYNISRYFYLILGWIYIGLLFWVLAHLIIRLGELLTRLVQSSEIKIESPKNIPHRSNWRSLTLFALVSVGAIGYFRGAPFIFFILICIGISWSMVSLFMEYKVSKSKNIQSENRLIKSGLILFGLSTIGFFGGSTILTYTQMYKFNSIVKKSVLYEAKNGRNPSNLEELNLDDKIVDSPLYSIAHSNVNLDDENKKATFTYKTAIIFGSDIDCSVVCSKGKPQNGPPYKFYANGYEDYKWYRFCYH